MSDIASLDALSLGFRSRYLTYEELTAQLRSWADAFPGLVRLSSLGQSLEGRAVWLLTLGPEPERVRPAAWVDGNMHATELCGSSVALGIAEDLLRMHLAPDAELLGLPPHVRSRLRNVLFHVLPRLSPDGAEAVLRDGRYVRSNPRDRREPPPRPRWRSGDVDGDGLSLLMRVPDESGEFVEHAGAPGVLLPRRLEDPGPYFKVWPEGTIEPWDGVTVPDPYFLSDNDTDMNRNFPWSWSPEPEQAGAGSFPASEPESRAVVEFVSARPNIFAWLNLHTFGGVYIRPLGHAPDEKMNPEDLAIFKQVAEWGELHGGYPTVSGFAEFLYEPDKPLHGDLSDFAYHQRGAIAYVCELWDLFKELGIARKKRFVDHYTQMTHEEFLRLVRWDHETNQGRIFRPWRRAVHPQLGEVEVGGVDPRVGLFNPPYERVAEICARQSAAYLRVAAMAPGLVLEEARVLSLGVGVSRVEVRVKNDGYLPTYGLASSKALPWNTPLFAEATAQGCQLSSPREARQEVGHLGGWGRGLHDDSSSIFHQRSRGSVATRVVGFTVKGKGALLVRVGSPRMGWRELRVEIE